MKFWTIDFGCAPCQQHYSVYGSILFTYSVTSPLLSANHILQCHFFSKLGSATPITFLTDACKFALQNTYKRRVLALNFCDKAFQQYFKDEVLCLLCSMECTVMLPQCCRPVQDAFAMKVVIFWSKKDIENELSSSFIKMKLQNSYKMWFHLTNSHTLCKWECKWWFLSTK